MTRPSSGVNPIVVSTERPSSTAQREAPAPRWQETIRARGRRELTRAPGGVGVGEAVEAEPAQRRSARATRAAGRRSPRRAGGWRGRRCRSRPPPARPGSACETASTAASDFGWCSGASSVRSRSADSTPASSRTAERKRSPPWTMRWPTASGGSGSSSSAPSTASRSTTARGASRSLRHSSASSRVEQRQLEAARSGVGDEDAHSARPGPVAHVGRVVAVLARVVAVAQALVVHLLAQAGGASRRGCGTRSITSITRWKRSRSLSMTMSNGVVVVPSSL